MAALQAGFSTMLQPRHPEGIQACPACSRSEAFTGYSKLLGKAFYADDVVSILSVVCAGITGSQQFFDIAL